LILKKWPGFREWLGLCGDERSISVLIIGGIGFIIPPLFSLSIKADDLALYVDRGPIRIVARVAAAPQHYPDKVRLEMEGMQRLTGKETRAIQGRFRLTIRQPETTLAYGDIVEMRISLRGFRQQGNPGNFPYADYLKRQGLVGTASFSSEGPIKIIRHGRNHFLRAIYRYRDAIRAQIVSLGRSGNGHDKQPANFRRGDIVTPTASMLLAMVIGESGFLADSVRDAFTDSGTNHILSISGSHLAMISFFVFGLSRWMLIRLPASSLLRLSLIKIPSQWAALITIPVVTFYGLVSGMATATQRSLVIILVYLFAIWMGRLHDIKISLALAAILILMTTPQALFDVSFQLSFFAVLFIVLVSEWRRGIDGERITDVHRGKKITNASREKSASIEGNDTGQLSHNVAGLFAARAGLAVRVGLAPLIEASLAATIGTAPLTLYYFHQFSWVGLIANLIVIPFVGFIFLPFGLISAILSPLLKGMPFPSIHEAIGSFYFKMTSLFAALPGADLHFSSPPLFMMILFYLIVPILFIKQASPRKIGMTVTLFLIVFLGWGFLRIPPKHLRVTFLDVGQGDSALIEFPSGKTMLVDAGSGKFFDMGRMAIAPVLWERKIRTIDYMVGTHPQEDHMGGFLFLIEHFHIGHVLTNGMTVPIPFYRSFLAALGKKEIIPRGVTRSDPPIVDGDCQIVFLNPPDTINPDDVTDLNNQSVVFRLSCPWSFLFTGDIEQEAIQSMLEATATPHPIPPLQSEGWGEGGSKWPATLAADILKVPHHGSKGSLNRRFMEQVSPKVAVFSAGYRNRYGHPHPQVYSAYQQHGTQLYRTDQDGAVTVTMNQTGFETKSFQEGRLKKINFNGSLYKEERDNIRRMF
jgi:competence protein ComEC